MIMQVGEVAAPLKQEVEGHEDETEKLREENDYFDSQVCIHPAFLAILRKTGRGKVLSSSHGHVRLGQVRLG